MNVLPPIKIVSSSPALANARSTAMATESHVTPLRPCIIPMAAISAAGIARGTDACVKSRKHPGASGPAHR